MSYKNNNYSKFVATAATATLVASALAPSASAAFSDVADRYKEAVDYLAAEKITEGYPGGKFGTDDFIKRQDAAVMIARVLGATPEGDYVDAGFTDVPTNRQWAVNFLAEKKIVSGKAAGKFGANDFTQRDEMAKIIAGAYNLVADETNEFPFTDVSLTFKKYVDALNEAGIAQGYAGTTQFGSGDEVTRGQFALFIHRAENAAVANVEVASVSATDNKTVELTGSGLSKLVKEDVAIEGNTVESVEFDKVTGKALVTFKTPFASGVEQTLVFTDAESVKSSFKFTFNLEVSSLEATTSRVDDNTAGQFLGFTINGGKSVSVQYLKDAGYTVDFQSTTSAIKDASTGELKNSLSGEIDYKVVVSKDGKSIESALTEVEVLDFETYLTAISDVTVNQDTTTVTSGNVSVQDGVVKVVATKATTLSGATASDLSKITYTSSNPSVASVNATTGDVTPIKAGSVTITASADDATVSVPLTVVSGAREATTATATTTSVKLLASKTQDVDFTVVDQYGDEFDGELTLTSRDAAKATGSSTVTVTDGKATGTLTAVAKGDTVIDLKAGTTTLNSVNISVSDDAEVATRKVETVSPSADLALDVIKGSTDKTVGLVWNQYNAAGFLIGAEKNLTSTYTVSSSNAEVATVAVDADGKITVTGVAEGTANVVIKEGTITRATAQVTVTNSTPTITAVDFETVEDVVTNGALNAPVLKAEGITLSSTEHKAEINDAGTIFIDVEGSAEGFDAGDITLGSLVVNYSGVASNVTDLGVTAGSITGTVAAGAEGTLVASVKLAGKSVAFATSTINVNVPK